MSSPTRYMTALDWVYRTGTGWTAVVKNMHWNPGVQAGETVSIDGSDYVITRIERQGEDPKAFGFVVRPLNPDDRPQTEAEARTEDDVYVGRHRAFESRAMRFSGFDEESHVVAKGQGL